MGKTYIHRQSFTVPFEYPVVFTRGLFDPANRTLADILAEPGRRGPAPRALAFVDSGLAGAQPGLTAAMEHYFRGPAGPVSLVMSPRIVPGGEAIKNDYRQVMEVVDAILEHRLCRHSYVLAVGGGAVLDAVGFAASLVHRGLRTVRVPSTVLAQNDAGVGVKNGMNLHGGKNTVGVFHPPCAVCNDFDLLSSLPFPHWVGGVAEAFKVAVIRDAGFFHDLCRLAPRLQGRDPLAMEPVIQRCALLHLAHIRDSGDPFELGRARPLDFGHWLAHKLESMSNYRIGHGQAVAAGVAADALYAADRGWLSGDEAEQILAGLLACGLPIWYDELGRRIGDGRLEVLFGLEDFREHLGGELCVTFPRGLGRGMEVHEVDHDGMEQAVTRLRDRAMAAGHKM